MPRDISTSYLSKEQMLTLSTKRLLAYRRSLLENPEFRDCSWWVAEHYRALSEAKEILDAREHIPRKT